MDHCYIDQLPPEMLSHIFKLGSFIDPRISLVVSWVSQHWRRVALSTHLLWDTITILNPNMILEYINRNPTCPITFTVVCRSSKSAVSFDCLSLFITRRLQPRLQNICLSVIHDDLEEDVELDQKILGMLFSPVSQRYQQLRSLSIGYTLNYVTNPTANDGLPVFAEAPELRDLRLRGLVVNSENRAIRYPLLETFSIINSYLDRPIHTLLQGMPRLERLSLILMERYDPEDAMETPIDLSTPKDGLVLNNLRALRILRPAEFEDQPQDIDRLLACLNAPNLKHFEWEVNYNPMATSLSFWERCASRFHTLTSLHLMGFATESPAGVIVSQMLLGWLESLQYLESFTLIFSRLCLYSHIEDELGVVTVLEHLARTRGDDPMCCTQLRSLSIGPILPRELLNVQSVVQVRPRLRAGTLRVVQYVDTKRSAGDASWLQANVSDFALETVSGHGRGFRYGIRHRYVNGALRKYSNMFSECIYFDQAEQNEPSI